EPRARLVPRRAERADGRAQLDERPVGARERPQLPRRPRERPAEQLPHPRLVADAPFTPALAQQREVALRVPALAGGDGLVVEEVHVAAVDDAIAGGAGAQAQVDVLPAVDEALVEAAQLLPDVAPQGEARTGDDLELVDGARRRKIAGREVEHVQRREQVAVAPREAAVLDPAVGVDEPRPDDPDLGLERLLDERLER